MLCQTAGVVSDFGPSDAVISASLEMDTSDFIDSLASLNMDPTVIGLSPSLFIGQTAGSKRSANVSRRSSTLHTPGLERKTPGSRRVSFLGDIKHGAFNDLTSVLMQMADERFM